MGTDWDGHDRCWDGKNSDRDSWDRRELCGYVGERYKCLSPCSLYTAMTGMYMQCNFYRTTTANVYCNVVNTVFDNDEFQQHINIVSSIFSN